MDNIQTTIAAAAAQRAGVLGLLPAKRARFAALKALFAAKMAQKSTWAGLATVVATATGVVISPENADLIGTTAALVAGAVLVKINGA